MFRAANGPSLVIFNSYILVPVLRHTAAWMFSRAHMPGTSNLRLQRRPQTRIVAGVVVGVRRCRWEVGVTVRRMCDMMSDNVDA